MPLRFAYADPPYLGCCGLYDHFHPDGKCWDDLETHRLLIERLRDEFPMWALSLHEPSLKAIRNLCPDDARTCPWVKPFASYKPNVNPAHCWEPVIVYGQRSATERGGRDVLTVRDYVSCNIALKRGTKGAKPAAFSYWLFDFLGVNGGDEFVDLFPGSGDVTRAWTEYAFHNPAKAADAKGCAVCRDSTPPILCGQCGRVVHLKRSSPTSALENHA